ncbi:substrate-binding periplasmic protein [Maridesulfovibrio salexigens]|uniref:Extracellular solute-binding protein family 3 n=1 Tax=Maridesulfovibrio salexigens (strain ATCC 14822 / DSM 2638 / NCIMB 8403 / VKM B-1763) TaxID=526222 RepID=C6BZY2_MARSD|nr:transporter substrate-binding domain-containing protein [Maridesulfovibrio salexigens]ACS80853.1 extracellular solute-binding protein family 3 [Maridesulfovibrio salexigens DSM 2638]
MTHFIRILFYCIFLLCATTSFADQGILPQASVATDYWPPFRIKQQNDKLSGIDIDMMALIGKRMGVDFSITRIPWPRCLLYMKSGKKDFMTGIAKTSEREKYIVYSDTPYYSCRPAFYSLKNSGFIINEYEDLKKVDVGYTRNSAYFPRFDTDSSLKKIDKDSEKQLLDMLTAGRLDVIIGTDCQVDYELNLRNQQGIIVKQPYIPDYSIDLYIGASKKSRWNFRMRELNKVLRELKEEGAIKDIADKYLNKN